MLSTGASSEGFQYEIVQTNLVISMLVTGFETYTKGRFKEIEAEGVVPNDDALIDETCSKREREKGIQALLLRDAEEEGKSLLAHVADSKINFQNFDRCKSAYNKAYGIRFGEIPQAKEEIESVREFIGYRHKIIHVSPLLAMLAKPGDEAGSKNVVFAKAETATRARKSFDAFINALHNATLQLR